MVGGKGVMTPLVDGPRLRDSAARRAEGRATAGRRSSAPTRVGRQKRRDGATLKPTLSEMGLRLVTFPPRYRSALEPSGELTPTWLARIGEAAMTGVLNDLLLFSCLAAFVTGVVIAAATILI